MEKITSRSNPLLVRMKKLAASASYRRQQGVYLCDSPKLLAEALKWHAPVREIVVTAGTALPPLSGEIRTVEVPLGRTAAWVSRFTAAASTRPRWWSV